MPIAVGSVGHGAALTPCQQPAPQSAGAALAVACRAVPELRSPDATLWQRAEGL